ncbi:hypothetical protein [Microbacterium invictum]|uniref:Uncharacterized protein n=1 Tax=Microbacterium invictum TaxID=515415 RepID=A0ABZ0VGN1_9MICO|nr:hypothetical protein [Microbacterium invictum]WQB71972.1 hypothetical protein T9R20_08515 [Microbacterium invictum]
MTAALGSKARLESALDEAIQLLEDWHATDPLAPSEEEEEQ